MPRNYTNRLQVGRSGKLYIKKIEKEKFPDNDDAPICKEFGCGKKLSPTEYLYSKYCFQHARQNKK